MSWPAAWLLAGALWAGCLLPAPWWSAVVGLAVAAGSLLARAATGRLVLAAVALAMVGAGLTGGRVALAEASFLSGLADGGGEVMVAARAVTDPRESAHGAWLVVRVHTVDGLPVRERAAVRVTDASSAPRLGEDVTFRTTARPLERDGFEGHLRRLHAVAMLDPTGPLEPRARASPIWRTTEAIRERTRAIALRGVGEARAPVLTGLVTGDIRGQSAEQADDFAAAGLTHLVVVSGQHVAIVLVGVLGLAALVGLGARGRRLSALMALGWFVLLVRWQPSVLRAAAMAGLVLGAGLAGRRTDGRHALGMAVLLLLLVDPFLAGHLGFALSAAATAGVLVLAPVIAERLPGPRLVRFLLGASLGAQLAVSPILVRLEGGLPLGAIPANLFAGPPAAAAQAIGLVASLVAQFSAEAGAALAALAGPPLSLVLWSARTFADVPLLRPELLISPVVVLLTLALVTRRRAPRLATGAVAATIVLATLPLVTPPTVVAALTVTALDVGQGDAILVEVPATGDNPPARLLIDGGPEPRVVLDGLASRRIRNLDAVALSHPDADHANGLPAVLERLEVGALLVGPQPLAGQVAESAHELLAVARRKDVRVQSLVAGQRFRLGAAGVEVLSPPAGDALEGTNANSLVLRVGGPDGALLTGDAEETAQALLLERPDLLRATVLKVPHHGGATNAAGFFDAVGARVALVSAGADNDYGHPHHDVLTALAGAEILRTDTDGTVTATASQAAEAQEEGRGDHYTARHAAATDVPVDRSGGAAVAPGGRAAARGVARGRTGGGRGRARGGSPRRGHAGPAHRLTVRRPPRRARPRGSGSAGRGREVARCRARAGAARSDGRPPGEGDGSHPGTGQTRQGARRARRGRPAPRVGGAQVGRAR